MTDPEHIAGLTGWTPYGPTWPPDGATVDVLHPDGTVSEGVRYEHAGVWRWHHHQALSLVAAWFLTQEARPGEKSGPRR
jgi:hypothetical protein